MTNESNTQPRPSKEAIEEAEKMLENEAIFSFPPQIVQAEGMTERKELVFRGKWVNLDLIEEIALRLDQAKAEGAERERQEMTNAEKRLWTCNGCGVVHDAMDTTFCPICSSRAPESCQFAAARQSLQRSSVFTGGKREGFMTNQTHGHKSEGVKECQPPAPEEGGWEERFNEQFCTDLVCDSCWENPCGYHTTGCRGTADTKVMILHGRKQEVVNELKAFIRQEKAASREEGRSAALDEVIEVFEKTVLKVRDEAGEKCWDWQIHLEALESDLASVLNGMKGKKVAE